MINIFPLFIPMLKITLSWGHIICSALPFQEGVALYVKIVELSWLKGALCKVWSGVLIEKLKPQTTTPTNT